jgi:uncharacterized protein YndB with AHSA1/START domain
MVAVTEKPSLTLVRNYKASPEKVWRALTEPEALAQWMGVANAPRPPIVEADVRVGGQLRIVMHAPDGEVHEVFSTYKEVVPNRRLVYSWAWKTTPERESQVTIELRESAGGTQLTLRHEQFFDEAARDRHEGGWNVCLARLDALLA